MEQNPIEQQKNKIDEAISKARVNIGLTFDNKEKLIDEVNHQIENIDIFEKKGYITNKADMVQGLKDCLNIEDRDNFINKVVKIMEPVIILGVNQPKIMDMVSRELIEENEGTIRLSEVLHCELGDKDARIHLYPARDFMTREKIEAFNKDIENGLIKLAEIIKPLSNIEKINATSWVIAIPGSARRLEKLGFTIMGEISKEEKDKYFSEETRSVASAFMSRDDFLARYGKNK